MNFETFSFPSRRSNIIAANGLVATSQPLAAQAGLDILKAGGNAWTQPSQPWLPSAS